MRHPLDKMRHGMVPGSHERMGGAECFCGSDYDYWADRCPAQPNDVCESCRGRCGDRDGLCPDCQGSGCAPAQLDRDTGAES